MKYMVFNKTTGRYYFSDAMPDGHSSADEHLKIMERGVGKVAESKIGETKILPSAKQEETK